MQSPPKEEPIAQAVAAPTQSNSVPVSSPPAQAPEAEQEEEEEEEEDDEEE